MHWFHTFIYSDRTWVRLLRHSLFWIIDIINYLLIVSINTEINTTEVLRITFRIPALMIITYFVIYDLIPKFTRRQNTVQVLLWIVIIFLALGFGVHYYRYYIIESWLNPEFSIPANIWDFRQILREVLSSMMVIGLATTIKLIKNRTRLQQHNEQLIQEKKSVELSYLRAQMQPHFLFNTLNTLYSETIQDSDKAQCIILHLSNLLRFMIEECEKDLIDLNNEIKVIQDLVALEQLRHGARLDVCMDFSGIQKNQYIAPLILIPFVENSFKHSLLNHRGDIRIQIALTVAEDRICFQVSNRNRNKKVHMAGSGINKTIRQLDLIYGNDYNLQIEADTHFKVKLDLPVINETT